jgi:uncharacterized membrane protein YedE/YeeE
MPLLLVFLAGVVFAIGLGISGMADANKVLGFLDPTGGWDPSLAFVMVGAIGVHALAAWRIRRTARPLFAPVFSIPTRSDITGRLVGGAVLFGVGWGISGFCPGPGIMSAVTLAPGALVFVAAMSLGMILHDLVGLAPRGEREPALS